MGRKAWPASGAGRRDRVRKIGVAPGGILGIDFAEPDENLERISWDEFFQTFGKNKLALLYQDEGESRFSKFVKRD